MPNNEPPTGAAPHLVAPVWRTALQQWVWHLVLGVGGYAVFVRGAILFVLYLALCAFTLIRSLRPFDTYDWLGLPSVPMDAPVASFTRGWAYAVATSWPLLVAAIVGLEVPDFGAAAAGAGMGLAVGAMIEVPRLRRVEHKLRIRIYRELPIIPSVRGDKNLYALAFEPTRDSAYQSVTRER